MDFLRGIFGDKALTYAELETALKDSKDIKLGNLAGGQYVDKAKLDAKIEELKKAEEAKTQLEASIKKFDGVDLEGLKKAATDWESKYNADITRARLESALELALRDSGAKSTKAVKAFLNLDEIKLDGEKLTGLDAQMEKIKAENDFLFAPKEAPKTTTQEALAQTGIRLNSGAPHGQQANIDYSKMSDAEYYAATSKKEK